MDLGPLIATYPSYPARRRVRLALILTFLLAILLPAAFGLYLALYGYTKFGPAAANAWGFPWLQLSGILLLAWLALLLFARRTTRRVIKFHQAGLCLQGFGLRPGSWQISWAEITGINTQIRAINNAKQVTPEPAYFCIHINRNKGLGIQFEEKALQKIGIQNLPELTTRLKAVLYARLYPELFARFTTGQRLEFGPLTIHSKGLYLNSLTGKIKIPWDQVQRIAIETGFLVVELCQFDQQSPKVIKKRYNLSRIPNLELLLQLVDSRS